MDQEPLIYITQQENFKKMLGKGSALTWVVLRQLLASYRHHIRVMCDSCATLHARKKGRQQPTSRGSCVVVTALYRRATFAEHIEISSERAKHQSGPTRNRLPFFSLTCDCILQWPKKAQNHVVIDATRSHPRSNAKVAPAAVLSSKWSAKRNLRNLGDVLGVESSLF